MLSLESRLEHHSAFRDSEVELGSSDGLEPNGPEIFYLIGQASVRDNQWHQSLHAQPIAVMHYCASKEGLRVGAQDSVNGQPN